MAWELRGAWAKGVEVVVVLDPDLHPVVPRIRGQVIYVSPTGAVAEVDDGSKGGAYSVPCSAVLAIRKPHFTEPLDLEPPAPADGFPGQLEFGEEVIA